MFVVGVYLVNGTFLGYQNLTSQLLPCSPPTMRSDWSRPGQTVTFSCQINVKNLAISQPRTLLYDLFMYNQTQGLYPVPVRNLNYQDANGNRINTYSKEPTSSDQLFRRFNWIDCDTGIINGKLKYIRIPTSIKFWMKSSGVDGMINVPVMDIEYTDRAVSDLLDLDSGDVSSPKFIMKTIWRMNYSSYYTALTIITALAGSVSAIWSIYKAKGWGARNTGNGDQVDLSFLLRFFLYLCGSLGHTLFLFLFGLSLYFLLFFKSQSILFLLPPTQSTETSPFSIAIISLIFFEAR